MSRPLLDQTELTPVGLSENRMREAVEAARARGPSALVDEFLPPPADPGRIPMLLAIIRADVGDGSAGIRRLADYRLAFPILDMEPTARFAMKAIETSARGMDTPPPTGTIKLPGERSVAAPAPSAPANAPPPKPIDAPELPADVAERLGFANLMLLGKGGFGSVYLAEQSNLGNRPVAIKFTGLPSREPQVLASLHHPNIVPVLSVHEYEGSRVFCMPFHGKHTLADVLCQIDRTKSLPDTGVGLLSTAALPAERPSSFSHKPPAAAPAASPVVVETLPPGEDDPWAYYETDRQRLTRLSYVDSVVMGMTRLADALVHAHSRRVIHLDIKPANILITDDGVFMILDFGLAVHNGVAQSPQTGGTIRYMAPEQLAQFAHGVVRPDVRMDLYSLGLVFFELLTGRHPFAASLGSDTPMHVRIAARHQPPPSVRALNPTVPPAVEAIVFKLLHPDKAQRYQSAEHLLVDLTRHQQNLPLKYAGNPSVVERLTKFRRRHPVFAVAAMALLLALLATAAVGVAGVQAERAAREQAKLQAAAADQLADRMFAELDPIRIDAGSMEVRASRAAALERVDAWWAEYGVERGSGWRAAPAFARLTADRQAAVLLALAEQALLAAHAERINALGQKPDVANRALDRAAVWNGRAEVVLAGRPLPPALVEQRAELARLRGRPTPDAPPAVADVTNLDLYLRGLAGVAERDYTAAIATLEKLCKGEPHHAAGQFALGAAYQNTGRYFEAIERYQVAKALAKADDRPAFNRGAVLYFNGRLREAEDDLTTALERNPTRGRTYYQRALVRLNTQRPAIALEDVERAIALDGPTYRYLYLRHTIRARTGDEAGAAADLTALDRFAVEQDEDFLSRGFRVRAKDREAALADFRAAADRNPHSSAAWVALASVQAELKRTADAVDSLGKVIKILPGYAPPRFDLAVLLARQGRRDEAVRLIAAVKPETNWMWYQRACVYSLGVETHLTDRDEAYHALRSAVQTGFKDFALLARDEDLINIRDLPAVRDLIISRGGTAE